MGKDIYENKLIILTDSVLYVRSYIICFYNNLLFIKICMFIIKLWYLWWKYDS